MLCFSGLLVCALGACSTHTGPDGARIYGPLVQRSRSPAQTTLTYSVTGFRPTYKGSMSYLKSMGYEAVVDDEHDEPYTVIFTDNTSGKQILQMQFTTDSDNFMNAITVRPGPIIYFRGYVQ